MEMTACPLCEGELAIKEFHCSTCGVSFRGNFAQSWISGLNPEQLEFIKLFVVVQGSIREMEKRLGISYPTVKNRLAEIIRQISKDEPMEEDYSDIMGDLDQGFISVEEALQMIQTRKKQ